MSSSFEERSIQRSAWPAEAQVLLRWVSTNNPFYVISAGLFLVGILLLFGTPDKVEDNWLLLGGLTSYTLLLAGTAVVLIRFAKVWDDARTVLLLVVLMFLATSATLDYLIVFDVKFGGRKVPLHAILSTFLALGVAIGVSEALLRTVRLRLPQLYRGPYYLILAVFLLYPLALTPFLKSPDVNQANPHNPSMMWGLFGFSSVAALAFLTLLPAIRRGADYVRKNGSPWPWPMYPWTLFGLLALAVPGRAILLCYSMHLIDVADLYDMTFGLYFLVPFGLVAAVLLLEVGIVTKRTGLLGAALALPIGLLVLASIGHRSEPIYRVFLAMFTDQLGGDPVYCTLLAAAGFYVYAAIRRVAWAFEALTATIALLTFVHPHILTVRNFSAPQPLPLVIAATLLLALGIWRGGSWRCLIGAFGVAIGIAVMIPNELVTSPYRWASALHVMFVAMLLVGALFDDDLARALRYIGPGLSLLAALAVMFLPLTPPAELPRWTLTLYPLAIALLLAGYGVWLRHVPTLVIAGAVLAMWGAASGWQIYRVVRTLVVGMDYLVLSLLVFGLAVLISLAKSRVLSRWIASWREGVEEIPD
jgi:hypothetical protein